MQIKEPGFKVRYMTWRAASTRPELEEVRVLLPPSNEEGDSDFGGGGSGSGNDSPRQRGD